jgi:hypothetical protein
MGTVSAVSRWVAGRVARAARLGQPQLCDASIKRADQLASMKTKRSMWLVVLLGGLTYLSYAVGVPHFTIERVTQEATLILVGDITEIKDLGVAQPLQFRGQWLQAEAYAADISVRRTIKGSISDHITASSGAPSFAGFAKGGNGNC